MSVVYLNNSHSPVVGRVTDHTSPTGVEWATHDARRRHVTGWRQSKKVK